MGKFVIYDTTSNTGAEYIDPNGENCTLEENAEKFDTEKEAAEAINRRRWHPWAVVYELN